jgi:ribose transport system ATP-binding protein
MGLEPDSQGTITVGQTVLQLGTYTIRDAVRAGLALVPADRHGHGIALPLTVRENATLPVISRFARGGRIGRRSEVEFLEEMVADFSIATSHPEQPIHQLSGGNQQKVALGKWFMAGAKILMLHEPTQGVDPRSRRDIFQKIAEAVQAGLSVIFFSLEYEDLAHLCDRVLVFQHGRIVWELDQRSLSKEAIVDRCYRRSIPEDEISQEKSVNSRAGNGGGRTLGQDPWLSESGRS